MRTRILGLAVCRTAKPGRRSTSPSGIVDSKRMNIGCLLSVTLRPVRENSPRNRGTTVIAGRMRPDKPTASGSLRGEPVARYSIAKWEVRGACLTARKLLEPHRLACQRDSAGGRRRTCDLARFNAVRRRPYWGNFPKRCSIHCDAAKVLRFARPVKLFLA